MHTQNRYIVSYIHTHIYVHRCIHKTRYIVTYTPIYIHRCIHKPGTYMHIFIYMYIHTHTCTYIQIKINKKHHTHTHPVFSLKSGTMVLPTFNFKVYDEKHCFTTLLTKCPPASRTLTRQYTDG